MKKKEGGADGAPLTMEEVARIQEAMRILEEFRDRMGSQEVAEPTGSSYPIPAEKVPGLLLTTREAAAKWGLSVWTVRRFVHEGRLRPIVGARSWLFKPEDIEGALERL